MKFANLEYKDDFFAVKDNPLFVSKKILMAKNIEEYPVIGRNINCNFLTIDKIFCTKKKEY